MRLKQLILGLMTIGAIAMIGLSLLSSFNQPQIQSRLELYQTNLLLHAAEWQPDKIGENLTTKNQQILTNLRTFTLGDNAYKAALQQYQAVKESASKNLEKVLNTAIPNGDQNAKTSASITDELKSLINELDISIGILQTKVENIEIAQGTWQDLLNREPSNKIAKILQGIYSNPAQLFPDAESEINKSLDGWFRYVALSQFYQLQQRQDALLSLQIKESAIGESALFKLAIVGGIPLLSLGIGSSLILFLISQFFLNKEESLLMQNASLKWETPWDFETILQVIVVGFLFVGQIILPFFVLPTILNTLQLNPTTFDTRARAFYILATYLLLAGSGLSVLYLSIKPFFPLPENWFKFTIKPSVIIWGIGGYFAAIPLIIVISLINQQFWQGGGGSNPILPIALQGKDSVALFLFFVTASIAAPVFEEIMFRGFLLPSLTRYFPVWVSICLSGLLFAIVHLQLSEILPLAVLGIVLGFVYTRTRSLLSPILLHSLWNSGTLLSLYLLGSGGS